jgi:hypothetical protein
VRIMNIRGDPVTPEYIGKNAALDCKHCSGNKRKSEYLVKEDFC